ncbi:PaaI family thioesterase [Pseudarthrobacter sp. NIBRBAC000502772]|uniref:PaaI family thioesterase n=1 Tax=Pseudarthrobacter sp. NIBRBAC000502772 TaxID=2590775 RepID=UPI00143D6B4C|nr:PaaI family thioesterase [Pseudarthrobacter sp. NIBRBAC000502772]
MQLPASDTHWDLAGLAAGAQTPINSAEFLFSSDVVAEGRGRVVGEVTMPASGGTFGWLGPAIDMVLGRSYVTVLPVGNTCLTLGMRLDSIGAAFLPGERVRIHGSVLGVDGPYSLTSATVISESGRVIGTGTGRFLSIPSAARARELPDLRPFSDRGVELAEALGTQVTERHDDGLTVRFDYSPPLANPHGVLHGGVQIAMFETAVARHHNLFNSAGGTALLADLTISFLSPVVAEEHNGVSIRTRTFRSGRRIALTRAEIVGADGHVCSSVTATFNISHS